MPGTSKEPREASEGQEHPVSREETSQRCPRGQMGESPGGHVKTETLIPSDRKATGRCEQRSNLSCPLSRKLALSAVMGTDRGQRTWKWRPVKRALPLPR